MSFLKKTGLPIFLATLWISVSEFFRNQVLLVSYWTHHYQNLGMKFPSEPLNGAIWGLWSLLFAIVIFILAKKFSLMATWILSWFVAFVLMWISLGNLNVLPFGILPFAIPLSLLEAFLASFIIKKLA